MNEKYKIMLDAMIAGVANIQNLPLRSEGHSTNLNTLLSPVVLTDTINALNHLNQFLELEQIPFDEATIKRNIINHVRLLRTNQAQYITILSDTVDNLVGVRPPEDYFKLEAIIGEILNDLTNAGHKMVNPFRSPI